MSALPNGRPRAEWPVSGQRDHPVLVEGEVGEPGSGRIAEEARAAGPGQVEAVMNVPVHPQGGAAGIGQCRQVGSRVAGVPGVALCRRNAVRMRGVVGAGAEWAQDRAALWNAAEVAERRKDAKVARDFAEAVCARYGVAADVAIHAPNREGDERNWHVHILTTTRAVIRGIDRDQGRIAREQERAQWRALDRQRELERAQRLGLDRGGPTLGM